jgi:flagellar basal-body rod protein FlgC
MISALDISTSGLMAQRARLDAISQNLANINTPINERGETEPYQERFVIFQADAGVGGKGAVGVKVAGAGRQTTQPRWKDEPGSPLAQKEGPHKGQVAYPDIDMMHQMTDALEAARSYEANLGAMDITKDLDQQTLRILA